MAKMSPLKDKINRVVPKVVKTREVKVENVPNEKEIIRGRRLNK